jgi:putative hemolysin
MIGIGIKMAMTALAVFAAWKLKVKTGKDSRKMASFVMEINEKEYTFNYNPSSTTAVNLATKFCSEHGGELGFTRETLGSCVEPLMAEIAKALDEDIGGRGVNSNNEDTQEAQAQYSQEGIRQIPLDINDVTYIFEYHDEMNVDYASKALAGEFCATKGVEIGITPLLENGSVDNEGAIEKCVNPLESALKGEIETLKKNAAA